LHLKHPHARTETNASLKNIICHFGCSSNRKTPIEKKIWEREARFPAFYPYDSALNRGSGQMWMGLRKSCSSL